MWSQNAPTHCTAFNISWGEPYYNIPVLHALGMHEATYMHVCIPKFFSILSIVQFILVLLLLYIVDCFRCITSQPHVHEVQPNTYMYMYTGSIKFYLVCMCQFLYMGMCALVKCMCMQILWNFRTTQRRRAGGKVRGETYSVETTHS